MSSTLTWNFSGLGSKTGTTAAAMLTDFKAVFDSKNADGTFLWTVAASELVTSPLYINLKRKDGSVGRILIVIWTSAPAGNNSAILEGAPTNALGFACYFPNGNVNTPSNLTASSGTIMGDDTGVIKATSFGSFGTTYSSNIVPFYAECSAGIFFGVGTPAASTIYGTAVGEFLVDAADNAYAGILNFTGNSTTLTQFGAAIMPWSTGDITAGGNSSSSYVRTNYGAADRLYFFAYTPSGNWPSASVSSTDILTDVSNGKAWFAAPILLGQTKGEGMVLKLRQICYGPGTQGPFQPYFNSGPTVVARQFCCQTTGYTGLPWLTNFKV